MFATQYVVVWCVVEGTGGRNVENGGLNAQKIHGFYLKNGAKWSKVEM